jgi:hypothetical protein
MRFEIILLLISGFIIANIYTDGKYLKMALSWKKYYQMAGVALGTLFLYWLIKKNPTNAKNIIMSSNEYIKYLPVDRNTSSVLNPILDFTSKYSGNTQQTDMDYKYPVLPIQPELQRHQEQQQKRGNKMKRSVSETKKKFVASSQNWLCASCRNQLDYTFEVDHTIALESGGTNDIGNLKALCPSCHRKKTAWENMI